MENIQVKKPFLEQQKERWEMLIARGKSAGLAKDMKTAIEYFEAAYKVSKSFPKKDTLRQRSAFFLGCSKFNDSDKTAAIQFLKEFLDHPESQNETKEVAQAHTELGAYYFDSDNGKATEHLTKAKELEQKLGLSIPEVDTLLAVIKMKNNDYAGAIPHYLAAYEVQKDTKSEIAQQITATLAIAHREIGDKSGEQKWQKENLKRILPKTTFSSEEMKIIIRSDVPSGWGKESLSHFLEVSQQNELATFTKLNSEYKKLQKINDRFLENRRSLVIALIHTILEKYDDDIDFSQIELEPKEWLEVFFYLRTQAAFAGASKLALSAQIPEMYMLLRGAIENAMYAFYVWKKPSAKDIWLGRDYSPAAKATAKGEFKVSKIYDAISSVDTALKDEVNFLYNQTIDSGAHPNVKTFIDHAVQKNQNGALVVAVTTLNPGEATLKKAMADVDATGQLVFKLFSAMYPDLIE